MARTLSAHSEQRGTVTQRPQTLATRLADFARHLRVLARVELDNAGSTRLAALYRQARVEISPDLSHDDFADLLAQVLVYCCLLVRCSSQERRETFVQALRVFLDLPGLPPFARDLLATLLFRSGVRLPTSFLPKR